MGSRSVGHLRPTKPLSVLLLLALGIGNWVVFGEVRAHHPEYWPGLRRHVLGPLDGFPLVRAQYYWCLVAVFGLDLIVLRRRSALARLVRFRGSERVDLTYGALHTLGLGVALPALLSLGLSTVGPEVLVDAWSRAPSVPRLPTLPNPVLQVLAYSVVVDFFRYWWHRWLHESRVLWEFHAVHHSATSFTIFTGSRQHPLESIFAVPVVVVPLVLLGASGAQVASVIVVRTVLDLLQHSAIALDYGWFGRWIFYSPVGHRIHHSPLEEHWDCNYGDFMPLWDHLFGTWYAGTTVNETVGVHDRAHITFLGSLIEPFRRVAEPL